MAVPDYQSFMLPLLRFAEDRRLHSMQEAFEALAGEFGLTEEDKQELLPSGTQQTFKNRIAWARTYLTKAKLLESPKRAHFQITDRGLAELSDKPDRIDTKYLNKYEEFQEFRTQSGRASEISEADSAGAPSTPEEAIENAMEEMNAQLASEILEALLAGTPAFFEKVVVELLVKMGYGGSRREAGAVVGRSGDGGIDGIIKEDRLGLEVIYVQAKRWENPVSRPEIQKFVGALQGQRARKGIFITTSRYSSEAREYVGMIDTRVVLIDGEELARLMIEHSLGTSTTTQYHLKRLDSDYFVED